MFRELLKTWRSTLPPLKWIPTHFQIDCGSSRGAEQASPRSLAGSCREGRPPRTLPVKGTQLLLIPRSRNRILPVVVETESLERETGFEPATLALARRCSTTELFPHRQSQKRGRILLSSIHTVKQRDQPRNPPSPRSIGNIAELCYGLVTHWFAKVKVRKILF